MMVQTSKIEIFEYPQPICELKQDDNHILIRTIEDAQRIIDSLEKMKYSIGHCLNQKPKEI